MSVVFSRFKSLLACLVLWWAVAGSAAAQTTVDLIIVKNGPAASLNGEQITYTITIVNSGPADADGATFSDTLPAGITNIAASCVSATLGGVCPGTINIAGLVVSGVIPALPNSGEVVLQITGRTPVRAGPTSISNTVAVSAPAGRVETNPGTNSSTANTSMTYRPADLRATKTISSGTYAFGDTITYVVEHSNLGTGPADGASVRDYQSGTVTGGVTGLTFSNRTVICEAFDGAVCPLFAPPATSSTFSTGTSFNYSLAVPTWPANGRLRFTVSYRVDGYVGPATGCGTGDRSWRINNAADSLIGGGLSDPVAANNTAPTVTSQGPSLTQPVCPGTDLTASKTQDSNTWAFGTPMTYTVVHTNAGPGDANGGSISDTSRLISGTGNVSGVTFDSAQVLSCTAAGGAVCPASFSVPATGTINGGLGARYSATVPTWPSGGTLTVVYRYTPLAYTKTATCGPQPITTATIDNWGTSNVPAGTTDPVPGNNTSTVSATGPQQANPACPQADIQVVKTQDDPALVFDQPRQYTVTWTNNGPDPANGVTIRDVLRTTSATGGITGFTYNNLQILSCTTTGGAVCPAFAPAASGSFSATGIFSGAVTTWPSGASITVVYRMTPTGYTGACTGVARAAIVNDGDVPAIPAPLVDPNGANNLGRVISALGPICADLAVTKSVTPTTLFPGGPMQFTLEVSAPAAGNTVTNATLRDLLPAGFIFDGVSAACSVTAGTATCGSFTWNATTREFATVIPSVAPGGKLQWVLTGQAINYSSSWFNTIELIMPSTFWDPVPATNRATVSINIQGADPKLTKQSIDKQIQPGSPVRYRLTLSNPAPGGTLTNVVIQDLLPSGFTFASTTSIDLIGGVFQTAAGAPVVGSNTPEWGTYQVPASGVIVIEFVANSPSSLACGPNVYDNSGLVRYVVSGGADSRPYEGQLVGNSADDVTVPCPATVTKDYSATTITSGNNTVLTFTVAPVTGNPPYPFPFNFTDTLPSGLQVVSLASNSCSGTITDETGGALGTGDQGVRIAGGLLLAGGTQACQIQVFVTNRLGQFNSDCTANPAAFTNGPANMSGLANVENGVVNRCLIINSIPLQLTKSFSPSTINDGQNSVLTLQIGQPPGHPATTVNFVDTLPAGLRVAATPNLAGSCNGIGTNATLTGDVLTVSALPIADNTANTSWSNCTITFNVTNASGQTNATCSGNPAAFTNGSANVTGRSPNLSYGSAPCMVVTARPTLNKVLSPSSIIDGDTAQLTITLTNAPSQPAQTGMAFIDNFPSGWRLADDVIANTCGGAVTDAGGNPLAAGGTSVRLANGVIAAAQANCSITVNVKNAAGQINASCTSSPSAWTNNNGRIAGLANLIAGIDPPQCLVVAPRIVAVDDGIAGVVGASGNPNAGNAYANDTLNGAVVDPATIVATLIAPATPIGGGPVPALDLASGTIGVPSGAPAGVYTIEYRICLIASPANCDNATITVTVDVASINAVDDSFASVSGASGGSTSSVLGNDTLDAAAAVAAAVNLTPGAAPAPASGSIAMNPDGTIAIAPGTTAGTYSYPYSICERLNPTNCDAAIATIVVGVGQIDAVDDNFASIPGSTGGTTGSVLGNDTLDSGPTSIGTGGNVTLAPGTAPTPTAGSIVMNADGTVTVASGTTAGTYTYPYAICETLNPANCDSANVTIVVAASAIIADDDNYSATPINGISGGNLPSVLTNDTVDGGSVSVSGGGNAALTPGAAPTPLAGTIVMNADGTISVSLGTTAGVYLYEYTICEVLNPANCDTATATVVVSQAPISAVDDSGTVPSGASGGTAVSDVLANDTLNNGAVALTAVTLTQLATSDPRITLDTATGAVIVAPGTPAGSYTLDYEICERLNPGNCDTAVVSVAIGVSLIVANADLSTGINGFVGVLGAVNVVGNDTLGGTSATLTTVTITTVVPATPINGGPVPVLNPVTGLVDVSAGTPAGTYTIHYTICENLNPTNCSTTTVTITVDAAAIVAEDDTIGPVNGATGNPNTGNGFANDTLNGAVVNTAAITATVTTPATPINGGLVPTMDIATGNVSVPAGTPAGSYTVVYEICEVLNPTNCDSATVTVTVTAAPIDAVDDALPAMPASGGNTASVLANDMLNDAAVVPAEVMLTPGSAPTPVSGSVVMSPDGTITVAPNTEAGSYTYPYTICEVLNPTNCDTATATIIVSAQPGLSIDKTAGTPSAMSAGGTIPYSFLVINTGNVTVTGLTIDDPQLSAPAVCLATTLTPGASMTCTGLHTITQAEVDAGVVSNTATATGTLPGGGSTVSPPDSTATTIVQTPLIAATKTATLTVDNGVPTLADAGDVITYAVSVRNTGNVTLNTLLVADSFEGGASTTLSCAPTTLAPGATATCVSYTHTVTAAEAAEGGTLENVATATALSSTSAQTVTSTSTAVVAVNGAPAAIRMVKIASRRDVKVGDLVRYTLTMENTSLTPMTDGMLIDTPPAGFTYVDGSLRVADADGAGRLVGTYPIRVDQVDIPSGGRATITYLLRVGAGVRVGVHTNHAVVQDNGQVVSNEATADVRLVGDPLMDESLILGTVWDDQDGDGWQDEGERGIPGVRIASVEGLLMETDQYGRYHLTGVDGGRERGRNFILKVDPATLPPGTTFTTDNPLVRRVTPGIPTRFDFGVQLPLVEKE